MGWYKVNLKNAASKAGLTARKLLKSGELQTVDAEAFVRAYTRAALKGAKRGWTDEKILRRAKARYGSLKAARIVLGMLGGTKLAPGVDAVQFAIDKIIARGKA